MSSIPSFSLAMRHRLPKLKIRLCICLCTYIENCVEKSLTVKINCVNNYLILDKVVLPQMCRTLVSSANFEAILTLFSEVIRNSCLSFLNDQRFRVTSLNGETKRDKYARHLRRRTFKLDSYLHNFYTIGDFPIQTTPGLVTCLWLHLQRD